MTTVEARKRATVRRKGAGLGKIRRGPGGIIIVDYAEAADTGAAPEVFLTGLCKIERLSPNTVRLSWYTRQSDGNVITLKTIMDIQEWIAVQDPLMEARAIVARLPIGDGRRKEAH